MPATDEGTADPVKSSSNIHRDLQIGITLNESKLKVPLSLTILSMKVLVVSLAIFAVALADPIRGKGDFPPSSTGPTYPRPLPTYRRFPREADPQGSVVLRGEKPLSGPDRRGTLNLEYQQKLNDHTSVYGGGHYMQGDRVRPHAGVVYERQFGNGFINGRGQVQPGAHGRLEPTFGLGAGFRFRREADPQGSVVLRGEKPLSGPDRRATLNLDYQQKLNQHTSVYGGGHYTQGDRVRPHAGVVYERQFGRNGFINGRGQVQPGAHGRLEPTFGLGAGWRFRRDVDAVEEHQEEEKHEVEEEHHEEDEQEGAVEEHDAE